MYATFEFYQNTYHGDMIAAEDWDKFATRASDYLDRCTRRRLENGLPSNQKDAEKVMKACCAIAEAYVSIDAAQTAAQTDLAHGGAITSISSGGESISFKASALSVAVAEGAQAVDRYLLGIAKNYLSMVADDGGVYYLYWGLEA